MGSEMKSRGQLTIFIIMAIILVVGIIVAIYLMGGSKFESSVELNPEQFVRKCVKDAVSPSVDAVIRNGGVINPSFFKMYKGEAYNYLCFQEQWYLTCVNHYPQLREIIEEQIRNDSAQRVSDCFDSFREEFESRGYTIQEGGISYDIELVPGRVNIELNNTIEISKGEGAQSFSNFDYSVISPLDGLIDIAYEIVNQEAQYCHFDYNGFMLLYPEFDIDRIEYDYSRIYRITDRRSGIMFKFAVRSCAWKHGI